MVVLIAVAVVVWAVYYYTEQHLVDGNGIPIRAISVADIRAHSESSLVYPGAVPGSGHANAQTGSTLLGLQIGEILPAQASDSYQTAAREAAVIVWYRHWLGAHRWATRSERSPADDDGIRFDRVIEFSRGNREQFSLFVAAFSGGTHIQTIYTIKPFVIVSLFA